MADAKKWKQYFALSQLLIEKLNSLKTLADNVNRYQDTHLISDTFSRISIQYHLNEFYTIRVNYIQFFESKAIEPQNVTPTNSNKNIKLSKIALLKFGGNSKNWQIFIDMYIALIHNNHSLSNINTFNYLLSSLQKEPIALV